MCQTQRRRRADLSLEVGSDADDASPGGHLEGEADDSPDLQQSLLTLTPATLQRTLEVGSM